MNAPAITTPDRSKFLGSSDMAAILGLSPWATPLDLFLLKRGEAPPADADPDKARLFRRGKRMEPVIVNMLEEERGLQIVARNQRYIDPEFDFLACEIDAEAIDEGERVNVECKSAHHFTKWKYGAEGTDETPIEYSCQAMFSLMITGRQRCIFGVLFGTDNLVVYELKRDEATIAEMRRRAVSFWRDHVLKGVPPPVLNFADVQKMFHRSPAIQVEASAEAIQWLAEFEAAKQAARAAAEAIEEYKFLIGRFMLGADAIARPIGPRGGKKPVEPTDLAKPIAHELTIDTEPALVINLQKQTRVDTDKVKKDYPEVAAECSYDLKFFKFARPSQPKKAKR